MVYPALALNLQLTHPSHEVKWIPVETPGEAYDAIKSMKVGNESSHIMQKVHIADPSDPRSTSYSLFSCTQPPYSPFFPLFLLCF